MIRFTTAPATRAATFDVRMLSAGTDGAMGFDPALMKIAVGDSITFTPGEESLTVESLRDMIPEGAAAFRSKANESLTVTFTVPGAYAVKCPAHVAAGMVGLIVVGGRPDNLAALRAGKLPKKAQERLETVLIRAGY